MHLSSESKALASYWSLPASAVVHVLIIVAGGLLVSQKAEFGMELAPSSVELDLVAAAPAEEEVSEVPLDESIETPEALIQPEPDDMLIAKPEQPEIPKVILKPKPVVKASQDKISGDGSSAIPGKDATTLKASRGSDSVAKPDYFRNPPPAYPEASRRAGNEGRVLLRVQVNSEGKVDSLDVCSSSGFAALDDAAVKTVKRWSFKPAKSGGLCIASEVEVPIRFQLN